jgi:hypothetical protein
MEVGMQGARGRRRQIAIGALAALFVFGLLAQSAAAATPPQISKVAAFAVTGTSATLKAQIDPQGATTTYRFEYGPEDCATSTCTVAAAGSIPSGSPATKEASLEGLAPATLYHYRVVAKHGATEEVSSGDRVFATRSATFSGLPDGRAYEQASPIDKDGGDVLGDLPEVKAALDGGRVTFQSTFGIPGGKGAQEFPTFLASRGSSNWSSQGLLPPISAGERAQVIGWSPDFTEVFSKATRLGDPRTTALIVQSTDGGAPVAITPYVAEAEYFYVGQSKDGSVVLFESHSKLLPEALEEAPNVYAWDRATGKLSLAGITNQGTSPPQGTLAGAYLWSNGFGARFLRLGGSERGLYLQDEHAVSLDGSVYFTEAGTGQFYRRLNPTAEQSPLNGSGECEDPAKACTIHVSATHRSPPDSAGPQPAAFQAASADGSEAFFTSPEKLTEDANTGPPQSPAQIERDDLTGGPVEKPDFITPQAAIGVAVDGAHLYWADPASGTIGRANLNGTARNPEFIVPGPIECEVKGQPGTFKEVESSPRYVAVDAGHVYWTNTGCSDEFGDAIEETGTIGRADINGTPASIEAAFIEGASNPQGIAVNATNVYWANAGGFAEARGIGRAEIDGGGVEQGFIPAGGNGAKPYGVALSPTHIYFSISEDDADAGFIVSVPLTGGPEKFLGAGKEGIRGVALDSGHVYWATQSEEAIGRANLELQEASREKEFIALEGKPNGLAVDAAHLYWATNGESATNPGNDLYRYGPGEGELEDLAPDASGNGAEVQGVLGASGDGKYVYFAANGVLAAGAEPGTCKGTLGSTKGKCSLYLWHEGSISLVARLDVGPARLEAGGSLGTDALDWAPTPREQFGTASYVPRTSFLSADGQTLLFRSQEQLSAYDNEGVPELYRFRVGDPEGIRCVSCNPAGEAAAEGPGLGRIKFPGLGPLASVEAVSSRLLSASGDRAFFETSEALVPEDTNGQGGCPVSGTGVQFFPACNDVYEWEAAGAEGCSESSPPYSPLNGGCIYLISTGKSKFPSLFADASADGKDVFFFTRQALVGQDKDELQDVYDARAGGGLAAQSPQPGVPCESAEGCHGPAQAPPTETSPATPTFVGPGNPVPKHHKQKHKKKHHKKKHKKKHKRTNAKGRVRR